MIRSALSAYPLSLSGGNRSKMHLDFVVGRPAMDVDGLTRDGRAEPVMCWGEWAFALQS